MPDLNKYKISFQKLNKCRIKKLNFTVAQKSSFTSTLSVQALSAAMAIQAVKTVSLGLQTEAHLAISSISNLTNTSIPIAGGKLRADSWTDLATQAVRSAGNSVTQEAMFASALRTLLIANCVLMANCPVCSTVFPDATKIKL
jgi:hypothetical protein